MPPDRKAYKHAWYLANKAKCIERAKAWNKANKEKSLAYGRAYYKRKMAIDTEGKLDILSAALS